MAKTFYFQLKPEGLGTPEVECLASYIHRIAATHGVTLYQLLAHLGAWWGARVGGATPFTKRCQSGRLNGYSPDVEVLVQALEEATGLDVLRSCTLLALRKVCAANSSGATKPSRAWCPICYAEAEALGTPVYDRLIWQIQGIDRCLTHAAPLARECWNCSDIQRNTSSKTSLSRCELCEAPLYGDSMKPRASHADFYNVAHVASLVEFTASNPCFTFESGNFAIFCDRMVERHSRRKLIAHLGDVFHKRWYRWLPKLMTMMEVSTYFDASLIAMLASPEDAAAQADFGFDPIVHQRVSRPSYGDAERSIRSLKCLKDALSGKPPFPSVPTVSSLAGVSSGYMRQNFPELVSRLVKKRKASRSYARHMRTGQVMRLLKDEERSPRFCSERERIKWIANQAHTSISHVRKISDGRKAGKGDANFR